MFERILIPLDGSPLAESILTDVSRILHRRDSEVILLRTVGYPVGAAADPKILEEAQIYVGTLEARLNSSGARARGLVEVGPSAETILRTVEREKATMIAMTSHGRTGLARWIFGSVAEKILRASEVPLLISRSFREGQKRPLQELNIRTVLVPIDESAHSLQIVPFVIKLAGLFESRVTLLHVVEATLAVPSPKTGEAMEHFRKAGISGDVVLREGEPAQRILEVCHEKSADLIAMSTHGRSGVSRWTFGSVTEKVLRAADVPMLVVRTGPLPE